MTKIVEHQSDFVSDRLTDAKREELAIACGESKRTTYYDLEREDVIDRNHYSLENIEYGILAMDWDCCTDRLGLVVAEHTSTPKLDSEGEPVLDENGEPVNVLEFGLHDFSVDVSAEGLEDANGTKIPKGKVAFSVTKQATNRPRNETNFKALVNRLECWAFNGEPLIKDANGVGASEQHRLIAKSIRILTGQSDPDDLSDWSFYVDGIHPDTVITIDTGKSNTGKDIFGSDPSIAPPQTLETLGSIMGQTKETELIKDQIKGRTKICGETESASKLVLLRLAGKNVNASLGNSQVATEKAHRFVTSVCPDMDKLTARCHVFVNNVAFKDRPVSVSELSAALSLWYLKEEEMIDTITREGVDGGRPMDEVHVRFDLNRVTDLLTDVAESATRGRLMEWSQDRASKAQKGKTRQVKFAQVVRMVQEFMSTTEPIDPRISNQDKEGIGKVQDANSYHHFGGADRGPIPKKKKGDK